MNPDTLNIELLVNLNCKVDSLEHQIEMLQVKENFFNSIISHQSSLLTIQTAIFVGILLIIVTFTGFIAWQSVFRKLFRRVEENEKQIEDSIKNFMTSVDEKLENFRGEITGKNEKEINDVKQEMSNIGKQAKTALINALRSLYENSNKGTYIRVIWHIRYLYSLIDNNDFIKKRIVVLEREYDSIVKDPDKFNRLKNFTNLAGILKTLEKLSQLDDTEVKRISGRLLSDLKPDGDNQEF